MKGESDPQDHEIEGSSPYANNKAKRSLLSLLYRPSLELASTAYATDSSSFALQKCFFQKGNLGI